MDNLDPFRAAEPGQARRNRPEVPPPKPREIRCFLVPNISPVKMTAARVDATLLPVANNRRGRPVQRTGRLPPVSKMFCRYLARYRTVRQQDAFKPDDVAADSRAECLAIGAGHPVVEPLELRQHRIAWRAPRCGVGLDRVQALQRGGEAVAPTPQQGQL